MKTNNVIRMLDSKHIPYTLFETPEEKLGALETASFLGISPNLVFKTIVILSEKPNKVVLAVVPGSREVDLKKLATILGEKKLHTASEREAETLTGLQTGGISPLAIIHKNFKVIMDESALTVDDIHISGGQRGMNIRLKTHDLIALIHPRTGMICNG